MVCVQEVVGGSYSKCFSSEGFFHLFITCKPSWIAYEVAIWNCLWFLAFISPTSHLTAAFSVVSLKSDFSFSFLQPIPGMGLCHLLHWLWSASLFQTHPSSCLWHFIFLHSCSEQAYARKITRCCEPWIQSSPLWCKYIQSYLWSWVTQ